MIQGKHRALHNPFPFSAVRLFGVLSPFLGRCGDVPGYGVETRFDINRLPTLGVPDYGVAGAFPRRDLGLGILLGPHRFGRNQHNPVPPPVLGLDVIRHLVGWAVKTYALIQHGFRPIPFHHCWHHGITGNGGNMASLAGDPVLVPVQICGLSPLMRGIRVTIRAGDLHLEQFLGLDIRAARHLVIARRMAGGAGHSLGHVNIRIFRGGHAVLMIGPPSRTCMAAQAHFVRWLLNVPGDGEDVHPVRGPHFKPIAFLHDLSFIIRSMAEQTIDVAVIRLCYLGDGIWLGAESRMTLYTTPRLCRFRGILGLQNSNPVVPDNCIGGRSIATHHSGHLAFGPIFQKSGLRLLLVVEAYREIFGRLPMAHEAGLGAFELANPIGMAGFRGRGPCPGDHPDQGEIKDQRAFLHFLSPFLADWRRVPSGKSRHPVAWLFHGLETL